jgi:hypothetical protein
MNDEMLQSGEDLQMYSTLWIQLNAELPEESSGVCIICLQYSRKTFIPSGQQRHVCTNKGL